MHSIATILFLGSCKSATTKTYSIATFLFLGVISVASALPHDDPTQRRSGSSTFYADSEAAQPGDGSNGSPFQTLAECVNAAAGVSSGSKSCILRGRSTPYYQDSTIVLQGQDGTDLTLESAAGETATIDGTVTLSSSWERHPDPNSVYGATKPWRTVLPVPQTERVWQVWLDGKHQTLARWPNADPWTPSGYELNTGRWRYEKQDDSSFGHCVDDPDWHGHPEKISYGVSDTLAAQQKLEGCPVLLNLGHWDTAHTLITQHEAGQNHFLYDGDATGYGSSNSFAKRSGDGHGRYMVEGCEQVLDVEREWAYDAAGHMIMMTPGDKDPNLSTVKGKIVTYALAFGEGARATVRNINFYGTTIAMWNMHSSILQGCEFKFPSFSLRGLSPFFADATKSPYFLSDPPYNLPFANLDATSNKLKGAAPTFIGGKKLGDHTTVTPPTTCTAVLDAYGDCTQHIIQRNSFKYTDGIGLFLYRTADDLIENNYFSHIDYSAVGIGFGIYAQSDAVTFRRNTLKWVADSVGIRVGGQKWVVELNFFTQIGFIQSDGAAIQATRNTQTGADYRYNWAVDSAKAGFRFDAGEDGVFGTMGTMQRNVGVKTTKGLMVKGTQHRVYNNLAFESRKAENDFDGGGLSDLAVVSCFPCSNPKATKDYFPCNEDTVIKNNGGSISGGADRGLGQTAADYSAVGGVSTYNFLSGVDVDTNGFRITDYRSAAVSDGSQLTWLLTHGHYSHNYNENVEATSVPIAHYLRDPQNLDFRPLAGSPLIDAGEEIQPEVGYNLETSFDGGAPDIGAYELEQSQSYYWIPGHKSKAASQPKPPDASTSVLPDTDLMFLEGLEADQHAIYVGRTPSELHLQSMLPAGQNVFTPAALLGGTYFWRVDALDSSGTVLVTGQVWRFTIANSDLSFTLTATDDTYIQTSSTDNMDTVMGDKLFMITKTTGSDKFQGFGAVKFRFGKDQLCQESAVKWAKLREMGCMSSTLLSSSLQVRVREAASNSCTCGSNSCADPNCGIPKLKAVKHVNTNWNQETATATSTHDLLWQGSSVGTDIAPHSSVGTDIETKLADSLTAGEYATFSTGISSLSLDTELSYGFYVENPDFTGSGNSLSTIEDGYPALLHLTFQTTGACTTGWLDPTNAPSNTPSNAPSNAPADAPSSAPADAPTSAPSDAPSNTPSNAPSNTPSNAPSNAPSTTPSNAPSNAPSNSPSSAPSHAPTNSPSSAPSNAPTTFAPTNVGDTYGPTSKATHAPSPSWAPSQAPSSSGISDDLTESPTEAANAPTAVATTQSFDPTHFAVRATVKICGMSVTDFTSPLQDSFRNAMSEVDSSITMEDVRVIQVESTACNDDILSPASRRGSVLSSEGIECSFTVAVNAISDARGLRASLAAHVEDTTSDSGFQARFQALAAITIAKVELSSSVTCTENGASIECDAHEAEQSDDSIVLIVCLSLGAVLVGVAIFAITRYCFVQQKMQKLHDTVEKKPQENSPLSPKLGSVGLDAVSLDIDFESRNQHKPTSWFKESKGLNT